MAMRWFRRNNKRIMAVMVVGLMIAFLIQPTIGLFRSSRAPGEQLLGRVYGKDVTSRDTALAQIQLQALSAPQFIPWAPPDVWRSPLIRQRWITQLTRLAVSPEPLAEQALQTVIVLNLLEQGFEGQLSYVLLQREAEQLGMAVAEAQVQQFLAERKISQDALLGIAAQSKTTTRALRAAIAGLLLVSQAADLANGGATVSSDELRTELLRQFDQLDVQYTTLPAERFSSQVAPPTDAQLRKHFMAYRDKPAGGSQKYGYGYAVPESYAVEYILISLEAIKKHLPDEMFIEKAMNYYTRHRQDYLEEVTGEQPSGSGGASGPNEPSGRNEPAEPNADGSSGRAGQLAEKPAKPAARLRVRPFSEVKAQIIEQLRDKQATRIVEGMIAAATEASALGWKGKRIEKLDPVARLNAKPDYQTTVRAAVLAKYGQYRDAVKVVRVSLTRQQAAENEEIGRAFLLEGQLQVEFPRLMTFLLDEVPPAQRSRLRGRGFRWICEDFPPLVDFDGNRYLFRVISHSKARPATLEDFPSQKQQVRKDYIELQALKLAGESARSLMKLARSEGLAKVAASDKNLLLTKAEGLTRAAGKEDLPETQEPAFREACFEHLADFHPAEPNKAIFAVELPRQKKWCVVQILAHKPVTEQTFREHRLELARQILSEKRAIMLQTWLYPDNIKRRTGYVPYTGREK